MVSSVALLPKGTGTPGRQTVERCRSPEGPGIGEGEPDPITPQPRWRVRRTRPGLFDARLVGTAATGAWRLGLSRPRAQSKETELNSDSLARAWLASILRRVPGLRTHDQRLRGGAELVVLHAAEELAVGDPGGGEEAVVALDQIVGHQDGLEVVAGVDGGGSLIVVAGIEPSLDLPAHALEGGRSQDTLGSAADTEEDVGAGARPPGGDGAGHVPVGDEPDAGTGGPHLRDERRRAEADRGSRRSGPAPDDRVRRRASGGFRWACGGCRTPPWPGVRRRASPCRRRGQGRTSFPARRRR